MCSSDLNGVFNAGKLDSLALIIVSKMLTDMA